jgi:pyruvate kinase
MRSASSALGYASVTTAANLGAKCIVTPTVSGATARVVSKFKPKVDIVAVSPNESALRRMQIYWGVRPIKSFELDLEEDINNSAIELAVAKQYAETGDTVILTAGIPSPNVKRQQSGMLNTMKISVIE